MRADGAAHPSELARLLRETDAKTLVEVLRARSEELDVPTVRQMLRNPFVTSEAIEHVLGLQSLLGAYELRRDLAFHPRTPEAAALRFVPGLFWRDLALIGRDVRVPAKVRKAADRHLGNRLPALTLGEKISLGRTAGVGLLAQLRHDPHPRVFAAVLENPKLTEGLLLPVAQSSSTAGEVLEMMAKSYRWGARHSIRLALIRNPRTSPPRALSLIAQIGKGDLRRLVKEGSLAPGLRRRARVLLGMDPGGPN